MKREDLDKLEELFWEYCKLFPDYEEFVEKTFTREEILEDIGNTIDE